jgi:hypothetical protein
MKRTLQGSRPFAFWRQMFFSLANRPSFTAQSSFYISLTLLPAVLFLRLVLPLLRPLPLRDHLALLPLFRQPGQMGKGYRPESASKIKRDVLALRMPPNGPIELSF